MRRRLGELNPTPLAILLSAVLASLLIVSGTSVWRLEQTRAEARLSRDIHEATADCFEAALDAEACQRGFLLTGREEYLQPHRPNTPRLQPMLDRLDRLTLALPEPHAHAVELRRVLEDKSNELARTVALMRAGKRDEALALVGSDAGRDLMNQAGTIIDQLREAEARHHEARLAELRRGFVIAFGVDVGAGLATLILGGLLIGINRDIRRRQELESTLRGQTQELSFSREQFSTTLRSIGDAVVATDRQGLVTFINAVAETLTGWRSADALGKPLEQIFDIRNEQTRAKVESPVDKVIRDGQIVGLANHTVLLRPDGSETAIADSAAPLRYEDGALGGVVLVFRDVSSERRDARRTSFLTRAAGELGSSLEYETTLRTVARLAVPEFADWCAVDLVQDGKVRRLAVAHVDPAKIALVAEIERRYPTDPSSPSGVPNVIRGGQPEFLADIPPALIDAAARDDEHLALIRSLGLRSYIAAPLKVRGQAIGAITFALAESSRHYDEQDLAAAIELCDRAATAIEHARLYGESQRLRVDAELANRAKDEFLAILGHELRNPLAPIVTALHLVRVRVGTQIESELAVIERQLRHVVRLVDDLLDVSRITRGRLQLQREPVDLADVMAKATELARPLIDERQHQLIVDAPPGLMVSGDPVRLAQIVSNLLANSAKYTDPRGRIELSARREGERIVMRVRDNGIGVTPEVLPRVFDLFVQEAQSIDRSKGGLGLGLAIVRSLALAHDGTVSAHSDGVGKGSEFVVTLPALDPRTLPAPNPSALPSANPSALPSQNSSALPSQDPSATAVETPAATRLLVVDDNVDALELMAESLSLFGYEAHKAVDAESALLLAAKVKPAIALLDLGLPGIDGYELARRLRTIDGLARIRLIAVTGYGQPSDRERSRAAGFDAHLVKPVTIETVRKAIEQLQ